MSEQSILEEKRVKKICEAIGRLLSNPDFQFFVDEVLVEELLRQRDTNDELIGEHLVRGQGQARTYRKILNTIDSSQSDWVKIRTKEAARVRGTHSSR